MAKVTLGGEPVGRIKAGWILFKETWRFLMLDKELLLIPIVTGVLNLLLFGVLITLIVLTTDILASENSLVSIGFLFLCYVIGAFTLALAQAATAHTVYTRAHGGDATLGESLKVAFSHWGSLFLWSLITSTVGIVLRVISERSEILGKIVAMIFGAVWAVLTYFVVPAMVISNHSAFQSIGTSARVFKQTWGEAFVSNISYGLVFLGLHLLAICSLGGLAFFFFASGIEILAFVSLGFLLVWFLVMGLIASAMSGILRTLLYIYATEQTVPTNFNPELLEKMLVRKNTQPGAGGSTVSTTVPASPDPSTSNVTPPNQ